LKWQLKNKLKGNNFIYIKKTVLYENEYSVLLNVSGNGMASDKVLTVIPVSGSRLL
jgi:hypothetical protein